MKRLAILAIAVVFSFIAYAQNSNVKQAKNTSMESPYKVGAKNISIGNPMLAQKVLWAWKYYDDNMLDKAADLFDDNLLATFPDGTVVKGKDNFMKLGNDARNSMAAVSSTVDACTTLKSPDDPNMQVVTIWGVETDTDKDGKVTKTHLNEVWFFNKQGKVVEFHQMAAKEAPDQK